MAGWPGSPDRERRLAQRQDDATLQQRPHPRNQNGRPIAQVEQGALFDLAASRKDSRRKMARGELRLGTASMYMAA
jgi:hypothetical protein